MATQVELAQLAAAAYRSSSDFNRISPPAGWQPVLEYPAGAQTSGDGSGFSASAYRGPAGEIVIAYTGTNDWKDWPVANAPAALGLFSPQVLQAARFYWQVLNGAAGGDRTRISFTGHSLGGGLASLMAVYFDRPATVFDTAPFEASAFGAVLGQYAAAFSAAGIDDAAWRQYLAAGVDGSRSALFAARERQVAHVYVTGEILALTRTAPTAILNPALETVLDSGSALGNGSTPRQLHSMLLAWSMLANPEFAAQMRRLPRLYGLLRDARLFDRDAKAEDNDLHALLMQREATTGMLTRFTNDVRRIADGFAAKTPPLADALIATAMAFYYAKRFGVAGDTGEATAAVPGGLQLALTELAQAGAGGERARAMLEDVVDLLSGNEGLYRAVQGKDRLTISDGSDLRFTDTEARNDLVLGLTGNDEIDAGAGDDTVVTSGGADRLDGGAGNDVLDAGAGDDVLNGGAGADRLLGGLGDDRYEFAASHGSDIVVDADGAGSLWFEGQRITGGKKVGDAYWISDDGQFGFTLVPNGSRGQDLVVSRGSSVDKITVRNWQAGQLGLALDDTPAATPTVVHTILGDRVPLIEPDGTYAFDAFNNLVAQSSDPLAPDMLRGTTNNDRIDANGGNDALAGYAGDDILNAGTGDDVVTGGAGSDRITGGDGNDALQGGGIHGITLPGSPQDRVTLPRGPTYVWVAEGLYWYAALSTDDVLYTSGSTGFGDIGAQGGAFDGDGNDVIDAGAGSDWVQADRGDDVVYLGSGADIASGGPGSDVVFGDEDDDWISGDDVGVVGSLGQFSYLFTPAEHGSDVIDGGDGNDVIEGLGGSDTLYGGLGADVLLGDSVAYYTIPTDYHGDDALYGGAGNDLLYGDGGNDELYGGDDDDELLGDGVTLEASAHGDDYLDGGAGNDRAWGFAGADDLFGGAGDDVLVGDAGLSQLSASFHGDDYLDGEDGADWLEGGGGSDTLFGGAGSDTLVGDASESGLDVAYSGADYLDGESGNDFLFGGGGDDTLFGGDDNDQLTGDDVAAIVPGTQHGHDYLDGEAGADLLRGGGADDTLFGGDGNDQLDGDDWELSTDYHGADYLDGGAGDDVLVGGAGMDTLIGGDGADQLAGDQAGLHPISGAAHASDYLDGGAGNDNLWGDGGADVLLGGVGDDYLQGDSRETAAAFHGDDLLDGGDGNDTLLGDAGADILLGGHGDDTLVGDDDVSWLPLELHGADILDGGAGNDQLRGGGGNDVYHFRRGYGHDTVLDQDATGGNVDTLKLVDLNPADVFLEMELGTYNLIVRAHDTGESIKVINHFLGGSTGEYAVERIEFADGTTWNYDQITQNTAVARTGSAGNDVLNGLPIPDLIYARAGDDQVTGGDANDALYGEAGNDSLFGGAGADLIDGGTGDDALRGDGQLVLFNGYWYPSSVPNPGSDTYVFARGYGVDTIFEFDPSNANVDRVRLIDLNPGDVRFSREGWALSVSVLGTTDRLYVSDFFVADATNGTQIDEFQFADGTIWDAEQVKAEVQRATAGDDVIYGYAGNDILNGALGNDWLRGMAGDDQLFGGEGNDSLDGGIGDDLHDGGPGDDTMSETAGTGNDRYRFGRGYGQDVVIDVRPDSAAEIDTLELVDLLPTDVVFQRTGSSSPAWDLTVSVVGSTDKLVVRNFFGQTQGSVYETFTGAVERIRFADGTEWGIQQILAQFASGTAGADWILGSDLADEINAGDGNDQVYGGRGDDTLHGGAGADTLYGNAGNNILDGGPGNDTLVGFDAIDNDALTPSRGSPGANTYVFARGYGQDRIDARKPATSPRDTVLFVDLAPQEVTVSRPHGSDNLVFAVVGGTDTLTIDSIFSAYRAQDRVTRFEFADGTVWTLDEVKVRLLASTSGNDSIAGYENSDDTIRGGAGNDSLSGRAGSDSLYGEEGNDSLFGGAGSDYLEGGTGDDTVDDGDSADSGWDDVLLGGAGNDSLTARRGNDVLDGGPGNDRLASPSVVYYPPYPGSPVVLDNGADTFVYGRGYGRDVIEEFNPIGASLPDTVDLTDLLSADVAFGRGNDRQYGPEEDLIVLVKGTNEYLRATGFFGSDSSRWIERVRFADGSVWSRDEVIANLGPALTASEGDDVLLGTADADTVAAGGGNDTVWLGSGDDIVLLGAGDDYARGGDGDDQLSGEAGVDVLFGGDGSDVISGGSGDDQLRGEAGSDTYVFGRGFGFDTVYDSATSADSTNVVRLTGLTPAEVQFHWTGDNALLIRIAGTRESLTVSGQFASSGAYKTIGRVEFGDGSVMTVDEITAAASLNRGYYLSGTSGADTLSGGPGEDRLWGYSGNDTLQGGAGDDYLDGGTGADSMSGGAGDDTYIVDSTSDTLTENPNEGTDLVMSSVTRTLGANFENLTLTGAAAINGTGNSLANVIAGNGANNTLNGSGGNDVLQGGAGNDTLTDTNGRGVHDGGDGTDTLRGGTDRQFFAGGAGNDTLTLGGGADILAFNRGHGADIVNAPTAGAGQGETNDTVSLAGVRYAELRLARSGNDLYIKVAGTTDSIRLTGWYAATGNRTVSTLQLLVDSTADYDAASGDPLVNRRIARLNFQTLVAAFDAAYNAYPSVGDWAIPSATLGAALVAGSDTDAIGGQLAYRYGHDGNLAGLDFATASAVLADANFGTAAQSIGSGPTAGGVRLMRVGATLPETGELDARVSTGTPLLGRTASLADDAPAAGELTPVQGVAADAQRVGLPRLLGRWLGEGANVDSGFWLKRPSGATLVAADAQPAPAIAIGERAQAEGDARVTGAPHSASGATLDGSMPSLPDGADHAVPPPASKLRMLNAAMVDAAITGAVRWGATDRWPSISAGPVERTAIAGEGRPEGSSLAALPRALARFASTDASVSARWQRLEAYLRAEESAGIAPTLGGEDLVDTGSLQHIGLGAAALAIDESARSMRSARRTLIA